MGSRVKGTDSSNLPAHTARRTHNHHPKATVTHISNEAAHHATIRTRSLQHITNSSNKAHQEATTTNPHHLSRALQHATPTPHLHQQPTTAKALRPNNITTALPSPSNNALQPSHPREATRTTSATTSGPFSCKSTKTALANSPKLNSNARW